MKTLISASIAALALATAGAASAQTCEALVRLDDFGTLPFGAQVVALPEGFTVVEHCSEGVSVGECVLRDPRGVSYGLYEGYVISKFVEVGDAPLPWEFAETADRTRAANLLTRLTRQRSTGVMSADNQVHVRSQFACGETFGQAFARYSGNRLVAAGLEASL